MANSQTLRPVAVQAFDASSTTLQLVLDVADNRLGKTDPASDPSVAEGFHPSRPSSRGTDPCGV
jgi:hypothetical protein